MPVVAPMTLMTVVTAVAPVTGMTCVGRVVSVTNLIPVAKLILVALVVLVRPVTVVASVLGQTRLRAVSGVGVATDVLLVLRHESLLCIPP